ncbi:MAG: hypothetical protein EOP06_00040 [Proteobacteria bacterium]|nr:MAG: hypothetical protein EOP06_00040 [Pseudomonadota bacterium]
MAVQNDNSFSAVAVIAHELGHGFDCCELQDPSTVRVTRKSESASSLVDTLDSGQPFLPLVFCLRIDDSAGAKLCGIESLKCDFGQHGVQVVYKERVLDHPTFSACDKEGSHSTEDQTREKRSLAGLWGEVVTDSISSLHPNLTSDQWRVGLGKEKAQPFLMSLVDRRSLMRAVSLIAK